MARRPRSSARYFRNKRGQWMVLTKRGARFAPKNRPPKFYRDRGGVWRSRDDNGRRLTVEERERLNIIARRKPRGPKNERRVWDNINRHLNDNTDRKWRRRKLSLGTFAYWRTARIYRTRIPVLYDELRVAFVAIADDKNITKWMKSVRGPNHAVMIGVEVTDNGERIGDENGHTLAFTQSWDAAINTALNGPKGVVDLSERYVESLITAVMFWVR